MTLSVSTRILGSGSIYADFMQVLIQNELVINLTTAVQAAAMKLSY